MTRNDWLDQATAMYLYDYVVKVEDAKIGFGYLPGLPDLLSGESDASALRHAVSANALASLAQRSSMNHLMNEARRRYGLALHKIKGDLTDDAELGKDSTLATILCLDFFEVSNVTSTCHEFLRQTQWLTWIIDRSSVPNVHGPDAGRVMLMFSNLCFVYDLLSSSRPRTQRL